MIIFIFYHEIDFDLILNFKSIVSRDVKTPAVMEKGECVDNILCSLCYFSPQSVVLFYEENCCNTPCKKETLYEA